MTRPVATERSKGTAHPSSYIVQPARPLVKGPISTFRVRRRKLSRDKDAWALHKGNTPHPRKVRARSRFRIGRLSVARERDSLTCPSKIMPGTGERRFLVK